MAVGYLSLPAREYDGKAWPSPQLRQHPARVCSRLTPAVVADMPAGTTALKKRLMAEAFEARAPTEHAVFNVRGWRRTFPQVPSL